MQILSDRGIFGQQSSEVAEFYAAHYAQFSW